LVRHKGARGLEIGAGYLANEWDFSITATAMTFKNIANGTVFKATYVIGDAIDPSPYPTAKITITMSTGEVYYGVVSNDRDQSTSKGPVTKFLYLGFPGTPSQTVGSFDAAMKTGFHEYVLVACLDDGIERGCDFSSAKPQ